MINRDVVGKYVFPRRHKGIRVTPVLEYSGFLLYADT